jgi:hypothetical protein
MGHASNWGIFLESIDFVMVLSCILRYYTMYHLLILILRLDFNLSCFFPGCLNGGGQIRAEGDESAKELLQSVEALYNTPQKDNPLHNKLVDRLYVEWLGHAESEKAKHMLHTQYHEVEKITNALTMKW